MTFKVEGFSVPKLEERLTDLIEQKIFSPHMVVIDGLFFDDSTKKSLSALKVFAEKYSMHVWFTIRTHRYEEKGQDGMPASIEGVADLFDVAIHLKPEGKEIHVESLKGGVSGEHAALFLDPSTMMIKKP
jgi:hypothetical protein